MGNNIQDLLNHSDLLKLFKIKTALGGTFLLKTQSALF